MINILPFVQSDDSRCGPAVVKAVLYYYGIDATEDEICVRCNHTYELGCTNQDIVRALNSYGIGARLYSNCDVDDLRYWIKHHIPVIIDWFTPGINPGISDMPNGHASVVVGMDKTTITIYDPEQGINRTIGIEDFMRVWFDWETEPYITKSTPLKLREVVVPYPVKLLDE